MALPYQKANYRWTGAPLRDVAPIEAQNNLFFSGISVINRYKKVSALHKHRCTDAP